jgi:hypothetical protein
MFIMAASTFRSANTASIGRNLYRKPGVGHGCQQRLAQGKCSHRHFIVKEQSNIQRTVLRTAHLADEMEVPTILSQKFLDSRLEFRGCYRFDRRNLIMQRVDLCAPDTRSINSEWLNSCTFENCAYIEINSSYP